MEKHERYLSAHKPNDLYWGIGLEEEFYLELAHPLRASTEHILQNQKPERYSVDYRTSFKEGALTEALSTFLKGKKYPLHKIPILVNSHSFSSTDAEGQPRTTYAKVPKPNLKFTTSVHELLEENSRWYKDNYKKIFCYDGNTFEIMTQNFYKTTAEQVCEELQASKKRFLEEIGPTINKIPIFAQHGNINYMSRNHGLATYMTNYNQINLCNNGTLHVNLTMPTLLNAEATSAADEEAFNCRHLQAARLIQWLEPLLLAIYGQSDFLSKIDNRFSACSQRGAISRYIGIANYDTNQAKEGKQVVTNEIPSWYKTYHATSAYRQLKEVGFDIQFRKFPKHGLELRIFDRLPDSRILPLVRFLVFLLDRSLTIGSNHLLVSAPQTYECWNAWLIDVLQHGKKARADAALLALYEELIGCRLPASGSPNEIYIAATAYLEKTYATTGECSTRMLNPLHVSVTNPECKRSTAPLHVIPDVERKSILCCH
jgi:hypothetical protein